MSAFDPARLGPAPGSRIAVVGGCGGMGRALVDGLLRTGCQVAVIDMASSLTQAPPPPEAIALTADATDAQQVADAFAELEARWGALDGFVNLVGFMRHWALLKDMAVDRLDEVFSGNTRSHMLCARLAIPLLEKGRDPAMVTVASTLGLDVHPGYIAYASAKAALIAMTKGLARECAPRIRVNALAPGITRTPFLVGGTGRKERPDPFDVDAYAVRVPLGRVAEPDDMAGPIMFLLGGASSFVTGVTLSADGGVYQQ